MQLFGNVLTHFPLISRLTYSIYITTFFNQFLLSFLDCFLGSYIYWCLAISWDDEDHSWSKFPTVTEHESEQVKGAIDFIGLIITRHFTVKDKSSSLKQDLHVFNIDKAVELIGKLYDIVEY